MMSLENKDDPNLNRRLLSVVEKAIKQCLAAYEDRAKTFAVILNDLEVLATQLQKKMTFEESRGLQGESLIDKKARKKQQASLQPALNKKVVYVRLFHREMPSLLSPTTSRSWIKPLLESVRTAEKHGLAIYASQEEVERSLKGDKYGYATLLIDEKQDITATRPDKMDTVLNCTLLTIANVDIQQLIKFTYNKIDYYIKDGFLQLQRTENKQK